MRPEGCSCSGDNPPSRGGCLKNEGGSFRSRIGSEFDGVVSGIVLETFAGLTTSKSALRSLSESWRTCTTQLPFFLSIVNEIMWVTFCALSVEASDASKVNRLIAR